MKKFMYKSERFDRFFRLEFGRELWRFLTSPQNTEIMLKAANEGRAPLTDHLKYIEKRYANHILSTDYPKGEVVVFINNMIKQIMLHFGYEHSACTLCNGHYIKSTGLYKKPGA